MLQYQSVLLFFLLACTTGLVFASNDWLTHGGTSDNSRYVTDSVIRSDNAAKFVQQWVFEAGSYISATPVIKANNLIFPSFDGFLYCLNKETKAELWKIDIAALTGEAGDLSRSSPAISGNVVVFGTQKSHSLIAVSLLTGTLKWKTVLNAHFAAVLTMSPNIVDHFVYIGAASKEELYAADATYACCSFVGSFHKVRLADGVPVWETSMVPSTIATGAGEYSGVGVWGSIPVVDKKRGFVYITTGNLYAVPQTVADCMEADPDSSTCIDADVMYNGVIALRLDTGVRAWYHRLSGYDAWNVACFSGGVNCPATAGPDFDFAMGVALVHLTKDVDMLVVSQKSGTTWSLNPLTGAINWATQTGPGGVLGGAMWGAATDGKTYYVGISNGFHEPYTLLAPTSAVVTGGAWSALDVATGTILRQLADPGALSPDANVVSASGAYGPPSLVNDVLIVGSSDPLGHVYVINAKTFEIIKTFETGGTVYAGAAISEGCFYIGSGYDALFNAQWTSNNKLYAYCLPANAAPAKTPSKKKISLKNNSKL